MKINNLLLGLAIGDAFGAGVEFQDRRWIKENIDFTKFVNARPLIQVPKEQLKDFTAHYHPWQYTDDTEMTIGLSKALVSNRPFSTDLLIEFWTKEYLADKAQKGYGRNGHGSMRWLYNGQKTIEEIRNFQRQKQYPGNAPTMRAVPLGLITEKYIHQYATINAEATHPHPKAIASSILIARASQFMLIKKGNAQGIIPHCKGYIKTIDKETYQVLNQINLLPPPHLLKAEDYQVLCGPQPIEAPRFLAGIHGLPSDAMLTAGAVLYLLKHSRGAFEGLKNAILLGGDVDSIASVCTGILAGRYGLNTLPQFMIEQVEGKNKLERLASSLMSAPPYTTPPYQK